jgi:hypothetical protein
MKSTSSSYAIVYPFGNFQATLDKCWFEGEIALGNIDPAARFTFIHLGGNVLFDNDPRAVFVGGRVI